MRDYEEEFDPEEAMGEVVDAAQLYLSECDVRNLTVILNRCMPYPIISAEDVELYAHKLRKECIARRNAGQEIPDELEAMREFFTRASRVIYLIRLKLEDFSADGTVPPPYVRVPDTGDSAMRRPS
jgi:hypothetical protein